MIRDNFHTRKKALFITSEMKYHRSGLLIYA